MAEFFVVSDVPGAPTSGAGAGAMDGGDAEGDWVLDVETPPLGPLNDVLVDERTGAELFERNPGCFAWDILRGGEGVDDSEE
jgi:hypothetical protein